TIASMGWGIDGRGVSGASRRSRETAWGAVTLRPLPRARARRRRAQSASGRGAARAAKRASRGGGLLPNEADPRPTSGTHQYTWNAFGQLESMLDTATGEETVYEYDLFGNLLSVALPDGRTVEYDVDGAGRRVGRRVLDEQGVEQEYRGWIYRDLLRPIAE